MSGRQRQLPLEHDGSGFGAASPKQVAISSLGDRTLSEQRKQLGAWYTPPWLVEQIIGHVLDVASDRSGVLRVLDPSCGDGRFLAGIVNRLGSGVTITGVDIDEGALRAARDNLGDGAELIHADALDYDWGGRTFDVVIGNPPFLSQMAASTSRGARSDHGGGLYADAAVEFLALSLRLASEQGSQVALVLPASVLSTRDAESVRTSALSRGSLAWFWWSPKFAFAEANVRTCALGWIAGRSDRSTVRMFGTQMRPAALVEAAVLKTASTWTLLIADQLGVPTVPAGWEASRHVGEIAKANANFRDEYYGLIGAVIEGAPTFDPTWFKDGLDGVSANPDTDPARFAPLITSGLIDPGQCHWGSQPVRFAKESFRAPVVDTTLLTARMRRWVARKQVPKVLLANQTRVIEAVVDASGHWLPSVPVINVRPFDVADLWRLAAVLSNPVTASVAAFQGLGAGLSASAMRLSAPKVEHLAIPASSPSSTAAWNRAAELFAGGDVIGGGLLMLEAYDLGPAPDAGAPRLAGSHSVDGSTDSVDLAAWWVNEVTRRLPRRDSAVPGGRG